MTNSATQPSELQQRIEAKLRAAFAPTSIELRDDSAKHRHHKSADGRAHFDLRIVSAAFSGQNAVQRHREVYRVLAEEMAGPVHALAIVALTPSEQTNA